MPREQWYLTSSMAHHMPADTELAAGCPDSGQMCTVVQTLFHTHVVIALVPQPLLGLNKFA